MSRRAITIWAMFAVFLHAALVVRHGAMVLQSHLDHELAAALGVGCDSGTSLSNAMSATMPTQGGAVGEDCPLCSGIVTSAAVLPFASYASPLADLTAFRFKAVADRILPRLPHSRPPSTGPPTVA